MHRSVLLPIFSFLGLALVLSPAHAQLGVPWNSPAYTFSQQNSIVWRDMRLCAQAALQRFPDHTPEANAQREEARLDCLRRNHLPIDRQPYKYQ